jgi:cell division protein FtsB
MRAWTIPIVLLLSFASGYTTFYGMQQFITDWIALIITVAVQSIIVITSYELAGSRWKANRVRFLFLLLSLLIAVSVSVSFSYFKFYQISETETIQGDQITKLKTSIGAYLVNVLDMKSGILSVQKEKTKAAGAEARSAYLGQHPTQVNKFRNQVGEGPFWRQFNKVYQQERQQLEQLENSFSGLSQEIRNLRASVNQLQTPLEASAYQIIVTKFQTVQSSFDRIASDSGANVPLAPTMLPYSRFSQSMKPSFSMWDKFALFPFFCALMVDFFTIILSYRLEYTAPAPLSRDEEDMVYRCLLQFPDIRVNHRDELELVIVKSQLERSRKVSDWSRVFATAFLLKRGYLRKVDDNKVEFSAELYPLVASRLGRAEKELTKVDVETSAVSSLNQGRLERKAMVYGK